MSKQKKHQDQSFKNTTKIHYSVSGNNSVYTITEDTINVIESYTESSIYQSWSQVLFSLGTGAIMGAASVTNQLVIGILVSTGICFILFGAILYSKFKHDQKEIKKIISRVKKNKCKIEKIEKGQT